MSKCNFIITNIKDKDKTLEIYNILKDNGIDVSNFLQQIVKENSFKTKIDYQLAENLKNLLKDFADIIIEKNENIQINNFAIFTIIFLDTIFILYGLEFIFSKVSISDFVLNRKIELFIISFLKIFLAFSYYKGIAGSFKTTFIGKIFGVEINFNKNENLFSMYMIIPVLSFILMDDVIFPKIFNLFGLLLLVFFFIVSLTDALKNLGITFVKVY